MPLQAPKAFKFEKTNLPVNQPKMTSDFLNNYFQEILKQPPKEKPQPEAKTDSISVIFDTP